MSPQSAAGRPPLVVIAGGGFAGVEAALGLREHLGDVADVALVAPSDELVHQALDAAPLTLGGVRRHPLGAVCDRLGVRFVQDTVAGVDPAARTVALGGGDALSYDALLVAVGARRVMALDHAVVFGSALDAGAVEAVLTLARRGDAARVAVVVPPGAAWSLPAYEVALRIADAGARAIVISPEPAPADAFGSASEAVAGALRDAGVELVHGTAADIDPGAVVLQDGALIDADATIALPWVRGPRIAGLPADPDGFLPTDPWCAVDGAPGVWAAGDGTTFPVRQGGIACQQAAVAAASAARALGAGAPDEPLRPVVRGALPTVAGTLWLEHDLSTGRARAATEPLWEPAHRIGGVRLPAFLERLAPPGP
jgi:sulfide:quinone oxidoreductase